MPEVNYDPIRELLEIDVIKYDITDISIDVKSNGTIIKLKTKKPFSENGISSFINKHGWYYLTISGGVIDTSNINSGITRGAIRQIESDQIGSAAQVAFKLGSKLDSGLLGLFKNKSIMHPRTNRTKNKIEKKPQAEKVL